MFNESILTERGFAAGTYHRSLVIVALLSLVGNFLGGWLAVRWSMNRLMALTMALLGMALCALPSLKTLAQVHAFSVVMGLTGGFAVVIFFSVWAQVFGRAHLGRIVGTPQIMTVLASTVSRCSSRSVTPPPDRIRPYSTLWPLLLHSSHSRPCGYCYRRLGRPGGRSLFSWADEASLLKSQALLQGQPTQDSLRDRVGLVSLRWRRPTAHRKANRRAMERAPGIGSRGARNLCSRRPKDSR